MHAGVGEQPLTAGGNEQCLQPLLEQPSLSGDPASGAGSPRAALAPAIPRARLLLAWDAVVTVAAFSLTTGLDAFESAGEQTRGPEPAGVLEPVAWVFLAIALIGLARTRDRGLERGLGRGPSMIFRLTMIAGVAAWSAALAATAAGWDVHLAQLLVVSLALPLAWFAGRIALDRPRRERVLIIGTGRMASHLVALSLRHPESGFDVIGSLDDDSPPNALQTPRMLGTLDDLPHVLVRDRIDRVIVCFSSASDERLTAVLQAVDGHHVKVDVVPRMFDLIGPTAESRLIGGLPLLSLGGGRQRASQAIAKRCFDLAVAGTLAVVFLPLMALIAVLVKLDSPGPVLYRSRRLGRAGSSFDMLKYRTMQADADSRHAELASDLLGGELKRTDDPRITRVGRLLRRLSLDELPQLYNIIAGSMSLVGPRPVLVSEREGTEGWAARRHDVRPGLTGLWQVLGRSTLPWSERMQLDYTYARHWSMSFDVKILASTVTAVASRRGAY